MSARGSRRGAQLADSPAPGAEAGARAESAPAAAPATTVLRALRSGRTPAHQAARSWRRPSIAQGALPLGSFPQVLAPRQQRFHRGARLAKQGAAVGRSPAEQRLVG